MEARGLVWSEEACAEYPRLGFWKGIDSVWLVSKGVSIVVKGYHCKYF